MIKQVDFAPQERNPGKRVIGVGVVLGLHLLLGWALLDGLAQRVFAVIQQPIEAKIMEEAKPPPTPPPESLPPPPKFTPPPPSFLPPPEVVINPPPTAAPVTTTTAVVPPPAPVRIAPPPVAPPPMAQATPAAATPQPPAPPRIAAKPAIGNVAACAPKGEDYPVAAVRAEATGTTRIRFIVDAAGKLSNAEIVKPAGSSGEHRQLDRVALAKLSECTFRPGNDDTGKPVGGTFEVEYVWKLE